MKAIAELEVSYRPNKLAELPVNNSGNLFDLVIKHWQEETIEMQEEVKVILLNRANKVLGIYSLATGGITSCVVDIRLILGVALKTLSTGIILVHNHPSGNLQPSADDRKVTEQLKSACKVMGIELLDHLIITREDYYSFADEGIL